jgi:hypothetical protein
MKIERRKLIRHTFRILNMISGFYFSAQVIPYLEIYLICFIATFADDTALLAIDSDPALA